MCINGGHCYHRSAACLIPRRWVPFNDPYNIFQKCYPKWQSLKNPLRYHHGTINVGIVDLSLGRLQP